ncbi:MAG: hypothetical protein D3903_03765 [Candidatus Electrothrix sp. GM3_4]|nr:hypothetical protein [Candidatus Electrothrix sp. GM3_4]
MSYIIPENVVILVTYIEDLDNAPAKCEAVHIEFTDINAKRYQASFEKGVYFFIPLSKEIEIGDSININTKISKTFSDSPPQGKLQKITIHLLCQHNNISWPQYELDFPTE